MTQGVQTVLCDNLEGVGWDGRWEGGSTGMGQYIQLWLIRVDVWQKLTQYCKVIILQLKINLKKKIYVDRKMYLNKEIR